MLVGFYIYLSITVSEDQVHLKFYQYRCILTIFSDLAGTILV